MTERKFILGSKWVYCKIYIGERSADMLLSGELRSLAMELEKSSVCDKWFFIRYRDNDGFHIRLRIHIESPSYTGTVISGVYRTLQPAVSERKIASIKYDTYSRELERYGCSGYDRTEDLFWLDSRAIMDLLYTLRLTNNADLRWKAGMLLVDDILDAYGVSLSGRLHFIESRRDAFRQEFGYNNIQYIRILNDRYRKVRDEIRNTMDTRLSGSLADSILDNRKVSMSRIFSSVKKTLDVNTEDYISSIMHMSMNRLFASSNRLCEMVIYDYLARHYESSLARIKYNNPINNTLNHD